MGYKISTLALGALVATGCSGVNGAAPDAREIPGGTSPVETTVLVEGLEHPWSLAFLPDGRMLVTERPGRLRVIADDVLLPEAVSGVPEVVAQGQGGLLDIALHPDFDSNRTLYLSHSQRCAGNDGNTTAVTRGELIEADGTYRLEQVMQVFVADACASGGRHHGSRLVFDDDGYLYVSIGDRGVRNEAQDPSNHIGSVLRLHDDGSVPSDNPFAEGDDGDPAVWSYGLRNIQGMALHPATREVWTHKHGPRGGDEINIVRAGRNYGWPLTTHGQEYSGGTIGEESLPGIEDPLHHWTPSIAPSGMAFYQGQAFPDWEGDLLVGALAARKLQRLVLDGETVVAHEDMLGGLGRIRDVRVADDGMVYLLTDSPNGALLVLRPSR